MPKIPDGVRGAVITGWGSALPPKVLTNKDLEQLIQDVGTRTPICCR